MAADIISSNIGIMKNVSGLFFYFKFSERISWKIQTIQKYKIYKGKIRKKIL